MEATCDNCGTDFEADTITPDHNGDITCPDCDTTHHY